LGEPREISSDPEFNIAGIRTSEVHCNPAIETLPLSDRSWPDPVVCQHSQPGQAQSAARDPLPSFAFAESSRCAAGC